MRKLALLIGAGAAFALTMSASADLLISNWPGNDGSQTAAINDGSRTKGMGFTMPGGTGYYLDGVLARLNITDVNVQPVFEMFSDAGGPGTSLMVLDSPGGYTLGIGDYTFTPPSQFTLDPGTTYWIVASAAGAATYDWKASSPSQTPTGLATHVGATFGAYPPRNTSSILVTYELYGTLIPAPSSLALLGLGGLALRRRR